MGEKTSKPTITFGIDPDTEKSGLAILKDGELAVSTLPFPQLVETIIIKARQWESEGYEVQVICEAGYINHAHWHILPKDTKAIAAAKGNAAGRNHEVARKIIEMLEHHHITTHAVKPLRKQWKGHDRKITHEELCNVCRTAKVTFSAKRSNQEERDAALLSIVYG